MAEIQNNTAEQATQANNGKTGIRKFLSERSVRERVMIYALIIIVVVACIIYFVLIPAMAKMSSLETEVDELQIKQAQTSHAIAMTDVYRDKYNEAKQIADAYRGRYYEPLLPETIDGTITGLLVNSGFEPQKLSMSTLEVDEMPFYDPASLVASALPEISADGTITPPSEKDSGEEAAASQEEEAVKVYAYTIEASAYGSFTNFYQLTDTLAGMDGLILSSFSFINEQPKSEQSLVDSVINPHENRPVFTLTFKIYVYVEGSGAQ